jgi:putative membrane protein
MSQTRKHKPAVFAPDDPHVVVTAPREDADLFALRPAIEGENLPALPPPAPARRLWSWRSVFLWAAGGLVSLGLGLAVTTLIEDLFARFPPLGWFGLTLAAAAVIALLAILIREMRGLARLNAIEGLRARAAAILASDDLTGGRAVVQELIALESHAAPLARARTRLQGHLGDIIDGAGLVQLAERELMAPLDQEARRLVSAAAKRVSIVTAVSPRAAVDMFFVLITALALARRLALLYGGRPGTLGLLRLARQVISHLAITGGMAASDSLIQQVIGHGMAAKLSARLGEGVLNGLLTARLGLAAIDVTRPLPFSALPRPTLGDLAGGLLRTDGKRAPTQPAADD